MKCCAGRCCEVGHSAAGGYDTPGRGARLPAARGGALHVAAFAGLLMALPLAGMSAEPERKVEGQTITSQSLPHATLTFSDGFRYAGGQRFELYGVADAEQHFFVDADQDHRVRRFYWVQFEHYLPDNNSRYNYPPVRVNDIGGLRFFCDTRLYTDYVGVSPNPASDSAKARALLGSKGFKLPAAAVRTRMIHLPGEDNRSELMIIFVEALAPGRLPPDAKNEMAADDTFPELSRMVLQHAKERLTIRRQ